MPFSIVSLSDIVQRLQRQLSDAQQFLDLQEQQVHVAAAVAPDPTTMEACRAVRSRLQALLHSFRFLLFETEEATFVADGAAVELCAAANALDLLSSVDAAMHFTRELGTRDIAHGSAELFGDGPTGALSSADGASEDLSGVGDGSTDLLSEADADEEHTGEAGRGPMDDSEPRGISE